ncbi:MAG: cation:proton antiporter [Candidatus Margulisiibacteriota bacterium]
MEHAGIHTAELVGAVTGLLLIAAGVLAFAKSFKLPFTVVLVIVGMFLAWLGKTDLEFFRPLGEFRISPDVILFVFLPTLIFESAYNLDARDLKQNLLPVLTLAIPGLLLSTAIIGVIIWGGTILFFHTEIPIAAALLLGAILSATDPVAVIALFKQLGSPKRLTVLVEGESLFNDATSIVLAKILLGIALAGYFSVHAATNGVIEFFIVFFGGVLVGWLMALVFGFILGLVESDPFIEISLTTILAYFSFLISEHFLHVSGVMATVAAGVTMGGWGRTKISPSVAGFLHHFWEYMAFVANALIFLLVGLRFDFFSLANAFGLLVIVIIAMLLSRLAVVFGLMPFIERYLHSRHIDKGYQAVMYWGGLRGAIALAIVLQLPHDFAYTELYLSVVMGVVLFTLITQGLSIGTLVHYLGLDVPSLSDRMARTEGMLSAKCRVQQRIPELQAGGFFSARIAKMLSARYGASIFQFQHKIEEYRDAEMNIKEEYRLLFLRGLALEKSQYYEMFCKGHLTESVFRDLDHQVDDQIESVRDVGAVSQESIFPVYMRKTLDASLKFIDKVPVVSTLSENIRSGMITRDYEKSWSRHQGSCRVLQEYEEMLKRGAVHPEVAKEIISYFKDWNSKAAERIDMITEQFPEFVSAMQEKLAARLALHAEKEAIEEKVHSGIISGGVAETMLEELSEEFKGLRKKEVHKLNIEPSELLRKVPFFQDMPVEEFAKLAGLLHQHHFLAKDNIIKQGDIGRSMYLIARGVVRVSRNDNGEEHNLATLMAGDFFGEMALLHNEPRNATCKAATPCAIYELRKKDFVDICFKYPKVLNALQEADHTRAEEIQKLSQDIACACEDEKDKEDKKPC